MNNQDNLNYPNKDSNKNLNDEVDECLDDLFKSTFNVEDLINKDNQKEPKVINEDFSLDKALAQSKVNININEDIENKFLVNRVWDCTDDNKIQYLENKVENIYRELDKGKIKSLISQIKRIDLQQKFYSDFDPRQNKTTIGSISGLDFLVENTFFCQEKYYENMILDRDELKQYLYKVRNVLGDGDCFYRGLIFSLMENIILTNNIMQMKELLILYHEKINLKNKLIDEKDYLKKVKAMNISIVSQILYILINEMENNISEAYISLLKVFLYCPDFDLGIIFFTRYLIYEYIRENEDKIYSREYQVEVGCLLPEDYVADKGNKNEYFYENFYTLQLLNPKTFAEKIVIYIAPYVFNINMNILMYDYGINGAQSVIQEKKFFSDNKNNSLIEINLLFRKMHYDIYYKKDYFEKYEKSFNILQNIREFIIIINKKPEKKVLPEKKIEDKKNNDDKDKFNLFQNYNDNDNNIDDNDNGSPKCLQCKKPYSNMENAFCLCDNCLLSNLKSALLAAFFAFIKTNNYVNCKQKLTQFLSEKKCSISSVQDNVSLLNAINNSKFKFEYIFLEIRKGICLFCGENINIEDQPFLELPCKCKLCGYQCLEKYIEYIGKYITLRPCENPTYLKRLDFLECFCGFFYHTNDVIYMITIMDSRNYQFYKEFYQDYIENIWNWRCMFCRYSFRMGDQFYRLYFKTDKIDKKYLKSKTEFRHLLCIECYEKNKNNIKDKKKVDCYFCEMEHDVDKLKEVDEENEDKSNCLIF